MLDLRLVAELRAVAARADIAQRVLTILEPGYGPKSPGATGQHRRRSATHPQRAGSCLGGPSADI
jgi:hypothetical protein